MNACFMTQGFVMKCPWSKKLTLLMFHLQLFVEFKSQFTMCRTNSNRSRLKTEKLALRQLRPKSIFVKAFDALSFHFQQHCFLPDYGVKQHLMRICSCDMWYYQQYMGCIFILFTYQMLLALSKLNIINHILLLTMAFTYLQLLRFTSSPKIQLAT